MELDVKKEAERLFQKHPGVCDKCGRPAEFLYYAPKLVKNHVFARCRVCKNVI